MLNKKPNIWIVVPFSILLCVVGGRYFYARHPKSRSKQDVIESMVKIYAFRDVMLPDDTRRVYQISDSIAETRSISDADLSWWIDFVNNPHTTAPSKVHLRRILALTPNWRYLTNATPEQRDRLYELSKRYLAPAPGSGLTIRDANFGLYLARFLNEKRVAPLLTPFLQRSPKSDLRQTSEEMLKRWNIQPAA